MATIEDALARPEHERIELIRGVMSPRPGGSGQTIRAEPFDAVELRVDELFGADPED